MSPLLAAGAAALATALAVRVSPPCPRPQRAAAARGTRQLSPLAVRAGCLLVSGLLVAAGLGVVGALLGLLASIVVPLLVARAEPAAVGRARADLVAALPWGISLLAAGLAAGIDPTTCLARVAATVPGPLGARLAGVAAATAMGAPPERAWAAASERGGEPLRPLADAFVATSTDGSALVASLDRLADDALEAAAAMGLAAARRVGVRAVLPLGLCFLPAFIAVGVVPVVASALGRLHL